MIVVSNTSPLNYLVLIGFQHVVPALFGRVLIPHTVLQELRSPAAPQPVREWLEAAPDWLESQVVSEIPSALRQLDAGERGAIDCAAIFQTLTQPERFGQGPHVGRHPEVAFRPLRVDVGCAPTGFDAALILTALSRGRNVTAEPI